MSTRTEAKTESTVGYILRISLTLLIITAVVAALLAGVNAITKDKIAAIQAEKTARALSAVLSDGSSAAAIDFTDDSGIITAVYESETGYAIQVAPNGFGGAVTLMVGVLKDGTVSGVSVISHAETAGLGAVAADSTAKGEAFRGQYVGMSGTLAVDKDGGEVDSISGATITSRAVTTGVNAALAWVAKNG